MGCFVTDLESIARLQFKPFPATMKGEYIGRIVRRDSLIVATSTKHDYYIYTNGRLAQNFAFPLIGERARDHLTLIRCLFNLKKISFDDVSKFNHYIQVIHKAETDDYYRKQLQSHLTRFGIELTKDQLKKLPKPLPKERD